MITEGSFGSLGGFGSQQNPTRLISIGEELFVVSSEGCCKKKSQQPKSSFQKVLYFQRPRKKQKLDPEVGYFSMKTKPSEVPTLLKSRRTPSIHHLDVLKLALKNSRLIYADNQPFYYFFPKISNHSRSQLAKCKEDAVETSRPLSFNLKMEMKDIGS